MDRPSLWRWWALPNEHPLKAMMMALVVGLISAATVSYTAVSLRPLQEANQAARRQAQLDDMLAALPGMQQLLQSAEVDALETRLVDLDSGAVLDEPAEAFDFRQAIADPEQTVPLQPAQDIAGIDRRPQRAKVHLLRRHGRLDMLVLPIYGQGYQSTIHALLVLDADLDTVVAVAIEEQGDTPGLGSRITDPDWLAGFSGRQLRDASGDLRFAVTRSKRFPEYEVDAIAGATRSSEALGRIIRFWVGEQGYGPVLRRLREAES